MTKKITVNESYQKNYSYVLSAPAGKNYDEEFFPELTPQEMLTLGIFEGNYFGSVPREFPSDWFKPDNARQGPKDSDHNFFKIAASKPLEYWQAKGWIHPQDPLGWFQWYCRYYMGRRSDDDKRQIKRWKAIVRHRGAIQKNCAKGELLCRRKQRQALLHWAYDSRKI